MMSSALKLHTALRNVRKLWMKNLFVIKGDSLYCQLLNQRNPDEEEMNEMIDGEKGRIEREMNK